MKDLKKISEVLVNASKEGRKNHVLFEKIRGEKSKKLLAGIMNERYDDDLMAAREIYNGEDHDLSGKKFQMLKSRVRKKMIEEAFFISPPGRQKSAYEKAHMEGYRSLSIARTFLLAGMRREAMELIRPLFSTAVHFRFTELILSTARMLKYNASLTGTPEEINHYNDILNHALQDLEFEIYSEKVTEELNIETRFSYSNRNDLVKNTRTHYEKLLQLCERSESHILRLNTYRIGIRYHEYTQDFQGIIGVCEDCESYLEANAQFKQQARYAEMALFKMDACLHLQNYNKGREYADVCSRYFTRGYTNWFVFMEYYFLLCLQTQNYDASLSVFHDVTRHGKFRQLAPERKEKWKLFEAYLNFMLPPDKADRDFRLYKFINEVPIYNRDKRGYNLSILIAQFVLLLNMKDHDRLLLKQDSFKMYFSRYVKKKYNYRSYYFSKMLMAMLRCNFNAEKTEKIARKFLLKLKVRNNRYHGDLETLEVIPYEKLWVEVIHRLKQNAEGSIYFIQPQVKRGRHKKPLSKNLQAALRYKEMEGIEINQVNAIN